MKKFLTSNKAFDLDIGLFILRVFVGFTMLFGHGWGKMIRAMDGDYGFADVFGMGGTASLLLAIISEVICSAFLVLGLFTRAALIPLIITMLVAVFIIHADDPFSKQEFGLLYLIPYITLFFTGAGKYALDEKLSK
ncbi:MAG: DoxX family protein [Salibacteraceae bacterium]